MLKFLQRERGFETVEELLRRAARGEVELLMSEINLGEVYYILLRTQGQEAGEEIFTSFLLLPLERVPTDFDLVRQAAKLKAKIPVSYAGCLAVAAALRHDAAIVTGDPEFRRFEAQVLVEWV